MKELMGGRYRNYLILATFGLLFSWMQFSRLVVAGTDTAFHMARYIGTWRALQDGQLIPQLDSAVHGGFGYAINLFYPPLSAYLAVIANLVAPSWNLAINLANTLTLMFAGFTMYAFIRHLAQNDDAGLLSAIAYMSSPYLVTSINIRFMAGEFLAMAIAPLFFLGMWKLLQGESAWVLIGLSFGGILLSHNLSAVFYAFFAVFFLLAYWRQAWRFFALRQLLLAGAVAFGISAFFLLPFLEVRAAADYNVFTPGFMANFGLMNVHSLFRLSRAIIPNGAQLFSWIGLVAILTLISIPFRYRMLPFSQKRFILVAVASSLFAFILTTGYFPWKLLPESFAVLQFPWRLNLMVAFFLSAIVGVLFTSFKWPNWIAIILVGGLGFATTLITLLPPVAAPQSRIDAYQIGNHWPNTMQLQNADYLPVRVISYLDGGKQVWAAPGHHWMMPQMFFTRSHDPIALTGDMQFSGLAHYGRRMQFIAEVDSPGVLELPLIYYPGYRVFIDADRIPAFESPNGFVAVDVPSPGSHVVNSYFGMSPATKVGAVTTGVTIASLVVMAIIRTRRQTSPPADELPDIESTLSDLYVFRFTGGAQ